MIKSLRIENFQSHKNTYLEFCTGINVITGHSNCGKTAILRSLNWLINNKPGGLSFKSTSSDKKDDCKVSVGIGDTSDSHIISRIKNTNANRYEIDSSVFDVIGSNVPSEVSGILNIEDINISSQFDKHFLLMESAGEVGRTINKIVKLDIIDELISNINSRVLSINKEIEFKKTDLDKLEENLKKFKSIEGIELLVTKIIKFDADTKEDEAIVFSLSHIIKEVNEADKIITELEYKFEGLDNEIGILESSWITYNTNLKMLKNAQYIIESIKNIDNIIDKLKNVTEDELYIIRFEEQYEKLKNKRLDLSHISDIIDKWNKGNIEIKEVEDKIEKDEKEFNNIIKDYGCPLCMRRF